MQDIQPPWTTRHRHCQCSWQLWLSTMLHTTSAMTHSAALDVTYSVEHGCDCALARCSSTSAIDSPCVKIMSPRVLHDVAVGAFSTSVCHRAVVQTLPSRPWTTTPTWHLAGSCPWMWLWTMTTSGASCWHWSAGGHMTCLMHLVVVSSKAPSDACLTFLCQMLAGICTSHFCGILKECVSLSSMAPLVACAAAGCHKCCCHMPTENYSPRQVSCSPIHCVGLSMSVSARYASVPKAPVPHPDIGDWWTLYDYGQEVVAGWSADYKHPYPGVWMVCLGTQCHQCGQQRSGRPPRSACGLVSVHVVRFDGQWTQTCVPDAQVAANAAHQENMKAATLDIPPCVPQQDARLSPTACCPFLDHRFSCSRT